MKVDEKLTRRIQQWLETPAEQRDMTEGATLLLKMNRNQVLYRNIVMFPKKYAKLLERELQKRLKYRVEQVDHEQVDQMRAQVKEIAKSRSLQEQNPANEFKKGKRADHDQLPEEIQAAYTENLGIMQRMRMLHGKLVILEENAEKKQIPCHDSDCYPLLQELIELDKKYHENWAKYDDFDLEKGEVVEQLDARAASRKASNFINLQKGNYRKNPTDELKQKLAENYALVINPTEKMTNELIELGVIDGPEQEEAPAEEQAPEQEEAPAEEKAPEQEDAPAEEKAPEQEEAPAED